MRVHLTGKAATAADRSRSARGRRSTLGLASAALRVAAATAVLLFSTLFLAAAPAYAQDKTLVWDRFDVTIQVQPDGTFDVCEKQAINFTNGSFTFGYRSIPAKNLDQITNWSVTDASGNTYTENGSGSYTYNVNYSGDTYDVRWYFPARSGGTETYNICYTVVGGLRYYEAGDQVWWKAIYGDRAFPVLAGNVLVQLPPSATVSEYAAYINAADARGRVTAQVAGGADGASVPGIAPGQAGVLFTLDGTLDAGEELEVRVQFPPNVVAGTAAGWQASADADAAAADADSPSR